MASTKPPRNPELEGIVIEALRSTPVDSPARREAWEVYADWLLSCGEPVGEWLAVSLRADAAGEVAAPVQARLGEIERATRFRLIDLELADLSEVPELERIAEFTWERGFITKADFQGRKFRAWDSELLGHTPDRFLAVVLRSPSACMLHELHVDRRVFGAIGGRFASFAELLAAGAGPVALRSLSLVDEDERELFDARALELMPALVDLRLRGTQLDRERPLASSSLRTLDWATGWAAAETWEALEASTLPGLERLRLRVESLASRALGLEWLADLGELRELELAVEGRCAELVERLVALPIIAKLARLRLGPVDEPAAEAILAGAKRLAAVAKLELVTEGLDPSLLEALGRVGVRIDGPGPV